MGTPNITKFTSYKMTEEEIKSATLFTDAQRMLLCNLRADSANELVNLQVNSDNVQEYIRIRAGLQGQIALIDYLLENGET